MMKFNSILEQHMEQSNDIVDKEDVAADFDADHERAQH
jgi:hypothetical protein